MPDKSTVGGISIGHSLGTADNEVISCPSKGVNAIRLDGQECPSVPGSVHIGIDPSQRVDLLHFKQGADVGIDMIITLSIVDFGIDQVGETWCSINDNLLAARPHCTTPIEL